MDKQLIVVDIESSCWLGHPPPGQQAEIIEIGICLLNIETGEITAKNGILVKPARSRISDFCTELTTLTQSQVDTGVSFAEACQQLRDQYDSTARVWGSWGDYDRKMFEQQCPSYGVPYPFARHINLKRLFAKLYHQPKSKPPGMAGALKLLSMSLEGTHHRGVDDAYNIARVTREMIRKHGKDVLL